MVTTNPVMIGARTNWSSTVLLLSPQILKPLLCSGECKINSTTNIRAYCPQLWFLALAYIFLLQLWSWRHGDVRVYEIPWRVQLWDLRWRFTQQSDLQVNWVTFMLPTIGHHEYFSYVSYVNSTTNKKLPGWSQRCGQKGTRRWSQSARGRSSDHWRGGVSITSFPGGICFPGVLTATKIVIPVQTK